jgi:GTP-binding protein
MHRHISTSLLNQVLSKAWVSKPPMFPKNKICKWTYISQPEVNPPTFVLTVNKKDNANFSFVKWIDNVLREEF